MNTGSPVLYVETGFRKKSHIWINGSQWALVTNPRERKELHNVQKGKLQTRKSFIRVMEDCLLFLGLSSFSQNESAFAKSSSNNVAPPLFFFLAERKCRLEGPSHTGGLRFKVKRISHCGGPHLEPPHWSFLSARHHSSAPTAYSPVLAFHVSNRNCPSKLQNSHPSQNRPGKHAALQTAASQGETLPTPCSGSPVIAGIEPGRRRTTSSNSNKSATFAKANLQCGEPPEDQPSRLMNVWKWGSSESCCRSSEAKSWFIFRWLAEKTPAVQPKQPCKSADGYETIKNLLRALLVLLHSLQPWPQSM